MSFRCLGKTQEVAVADPTQHECASVVAASHRLFSDSQISRLKSRKVEGRSPSERPLLHQPRADATGSRRGGGHRRPGARRAPVASRFLFAAVGGESVNAFAAADAEPEKRQGHLDWTTFS